MDRKINLFLLGSPKCGTTALYEFIKEHKDIYFPDFKEPHYFATDLEGYKAHNDELSFFQLYNNVNNQKIIGDASIFNLYSETAIKNIKEYNCDARIIVMIRNPIEAVPSFHSQVLFSQDENVKECEEAWDLSESRRIGANVPKVCKCAKILDYKEIYSYATQLERLYEIFDKSQVLVLTHDEMKTSFDSMVSKVFEFLDVDCIKIENRMINPNTVNRSSFVSKYLRHPPKPLRVLKRLIMGRGRNKLYNYLLEINTKYEKRVNISSSLKSKIMTNYLEEICKTETLLGKNLDEWKGKKQ